MSVFCEPYLNFYVPVWQIISIYSQINVHQGVINFDNCVKLKLYYMEIIIKKKEKEEERNIQTNTNATDRMEVVNRGSCWWRTDTDATKWAHNRI